MDYNVSGQNDYKDILIKGIYTNMPRYLASKHRVHKLFFKKCDNDISEYEQCLGDSNWYYYL